mgnify:FL=1
MQSKTDTAITADTVVTGAEFRDFYQNRWPKEWYVEEMPHEAEDERGQWVLPDDAERPLSWFGYAAWQGPAGQGRERGEMIPMHELYAKVMGHGPQEALIAFKIDPEKAPELIKAAEALGARHI